MKHMTTLTKYQVAAKLYERGAITLEMMLQVWDIYEQEDEICDTSL